MIQVLLVNLQVRAPQPGHLTPEYYCKCQLRSPPGEGLDVITTGSRCKAGSTES